MLYLRLTDLSFVTEAELDMPAGRMDPEMPRDNMALENLADNEDLLQPQGSVLSGMQPFFSNQFAPQSDSGFEAPSLDMSEDGIMMER